MSPPPADASADVRRPAGLAPEAYEEIPGEQYRPYVPPETSMAETTVTSVVLGALFGILFGAANAYLGLRVGLTISTSIPVAVLTVAVFAAITVVGGRKRTILEANLSQTIGSASSSVASGVIFTLPAMYLWGLDPALGKMTMIAAAGGLLGVLFMVSLRRFLICGEHGRLPYPEGTACAEVLVASEVGGAQARHVFSGLGVGALYRLLQGAVHLWHGEVKTRVPVLPKAELSLETSPALLGVGYILGPRIAAVMVGGGLLAWLVIIPTIAWIGDGWATPLYPETVKLVRAMEPGELWNRYIRYLGAGAVAMAGIITLVKSLPMMVESFRIGLAQMRRRLGGEVDTGGDRTDRDLPLQWVGGGVLVVVLALAFIPYVLGFLDSAVMRLVAALAMAVFAFFFVTVSSRIVGLVGVTSNPTSGMIIATLLGTAGLFLLLGWTDPAGQVAALSVGAVVGIAASIAGDTSQDLKTGFLVGATPSRQQIGEIIGVLTCAFFVCLTVKVLADAFGFKALKPDSPEALAAPQATLVSLVIRGVLDQNLPWILVGIGAGIAVLATLLRIPPLPFAVGIYLPVSTMTPVFVGGLVRLLMERGAGDDASRRERRERGVLFGSGLVGGEGLLGVGIAAYAVITTRKPVGLGEAWAGPLEAVMPLLPFAILVWLLWRSARGARAAS